MPVFGHVVKKYQFKCIWNENLSYQLNVLCCKKIFRDTEVSLVTGSDNGTVQVHKAIKVNNVISGFEKNGRSYETKGGSIQTLLPQNVTKFSSEDVLVGDANGLFTIITNGQILNRRSLCGSRIAAVVVDVDSAGNTSIVVGSSDGTMVAVTPYDILWKCRLSEVLKQEERFSANSSISSMHVFRMQSASADTSYVIVADAEKRIHFFQNERLVTTLLVPSVVTSMCSGYFLNEDCPNDSPSKSTASPLKGQRGYDEQVALATRSGAVFILSNFNVVPYTNLSYPITQIKSLPASGSDDVDALLCCGHFNKLCILQNRMCVSTFTTEDWIHSFDFVDAAVCGDSLLLVLGCVDNSVRILEIEKTR
ncbi:uncharacterized protein LOC130656773 [Hydractinia symbiolongicarpus]|uniref:uncharacterized protein LOC130656773 n=1 Tax=Hydractinia symbiolongicarpus TaxID=13093 RepID=UPI00254C3A08|nr:uncharacterized protein LOC130656773 [Hydractinia symbiolongicarpus]